MDEDDVRCTKVEPDVRIRDRIAANLQPTRRNALAILQLPRQPAQETTADGADRSPETGSKQKFAIGLEPAERFLRQELLLRVPYDTKDKNDLSFSRNAKDST